MNKIETIKTYEVKDGDKLLGIVKLIYADKWGKLRIKSIYGDFKHDWYSLGKEFRLFLGKANIGYYLTVKLIDDSKYSIFDVEGTIRNIKECIIKNRRKLYISEKEARAVWNEIPKQGDCLDYYYFIQNHCMDDLDESLLTEKYIDKIENFRTIFLPKMQEILIKDYYS